MEELSLLEHQGGVCGHLVVRSVAADDDGRAWVLWAAVGSSDYRGGSGEVAGAVSVPVTKAAAGDPAQRTVRIEARDYVSARRMKVVAAATAQLDPLLRGEVDRINVALLEGNKEGGYGGATVKKKTTNIEVSVEYRPHGYEPVKGDLVLVEPFAAMRPADEAGEGVLPLSSSVLKVEAVDDADGTVVVAWDHRLRSRGTKDEAWRCAVRVPRRALFVVHRVTWTERLVFDPACAVFSKEVVNGVAAAVRPAVTSARVLMAPVIHTSRFALANLAQVTIAALEPVFSRPPATANLGPDLKPAGASLPTAPRF